jgi:hypothetical protein
MRRHPQTKITVKVNRIRRDRLDKNCLKYGRWALAKIINEFIIFLEARSQCSIPHSGIERRFTAILSNSYQRKAMK